LKPYVTVRMTESAYQQLGPVIRMKVLNGFRRNLVLRSILIVVMRI